MSEFLVPLLDALRWGGDEGTPRQVRDLVMASAPISLVPEGMRPHVNHVGLLVEDLSTGFDLDPVVLGVDGTLWDGLHRLIAYSVAGRLYCLAIDFQETDLSSRAIGGPVDGLRKKVQSRWLMPNEMVRASGRFAAAEGFRRFVFDKFLESNFAMGCLHDIERVAAWNRVETEFYSQDEYILGKEGDRDMGGSLTRLMRTFSSIEMRSWIARAIGCIVAVPPTAVAHRLRRGDYIGFHNDYRKDGEMIRLVLMLGNGNNEGGVFVAMGGNDAGNGNEALEAVFQEHNRLLAFCVSRRSYHLVTEVNEGDRYSVVFSYHPESLG